MDLDIRGDFREVQRLLTRTERQILPKVTTRALNKVATQVQNRTLRLICDDLGFTRVYGRREGVRKLRRYLRTRKANWRNLSASIEATGRRIPVHRLDAEQTAEGVEYVGQDGQQRLIPGAFIAEIRVAGVPGAYKRRGRARFPVMFLRTVSVPHVFIQQHMARAMEEIATESWGRNWPHEVRRELRRLWSR